MIENHILVKTTQQSVLENILYDLANLYSDTDYVKGIQLFRKKEMIDSFLILFTNNPDLDRFSYFTNYIVYPMNHPNFKGTVRGFYKTSDIITLPKLNSGKWIMMYIDENDKDGDSVNLVDEANNNFNYNFGGVLKKLDMQVKTFTLYDVQKENYHHITDIFPSPSNKIIRDKPWWKFW